MPHSVKVVAPPQRFLFSSSHVFFFSFCSLSLCTQIFKRSIMKLYSYVLILFQLHELQSIRCYSCVGRVNQKNTNDPCLNPAENVGDGRVSEIECLNSKLCWKSITGGQLKRGCGEKRCALVPDISIGSLMTQTCCSNDLCNRSSTQISSLWMCSIVLLFLNLMNNFASIDLRILFN